MDDVDLDVQAKFYQILSKISSEKAHRAKKELRSISSEKTRQAELFAEPQVVRHKTSPKSKDDEIVGYVTDINGTGKIHKKKGCYKAYDPITRKQKAEQKGTFCARCK